jgi:molecular chaperone DnaK
VSFHPQGHVLIGTTPRQRRVIDPKNTVSSFKRIMGRRFGSLEVNREQRRARLPIKRAPNEQPVIAVRARRVHAARAVGDPARPHAQHRAKALGQQVARAVVTVPANFNDAQRQATALAGEIADLVVVRILNEPTAAALAYGHGRRCSRRWRSTTSAAARSTSRCWQLRDNVYEVLATAGDTFLGGDDIDERIVEYMARCSCSSTASICADDDRDAAPARGRRAGEDRAVVQAARVVTVQEVARRRGRRALDLQFTLTARGAGEARRRRGRALVPGVRRGVPAGGLAPSQIDEVVLVGGTPRMPYCARARRRYFGGPRTDVNPTRRSPGARRSRATRLASCSTSRAADHTDQRRAARRLAQDPRRTVQAGDRGRGRGRRAAATPASHRRCRARPTHRRANRAPRRCTRRRRLARTTARSGGAGAAHHRPSARAAAAIAACRSSRWRCRARYRLVPRAQPGGEKLDFTGISTDVATEERTFPAATAATSSRCRACSSCPSRDPDAPAAAWTGCRQLPNAPRPILLDVTPRALCVATVGGYCDEIIKRNSQIPIEQTRVFTTRAHDNRPRSRIRDGQGESNKFAENTLLGSLVLEGLEPRSRGAQKIAVPSVIDTDGILQVSGSGRPGDHKAQSARNRVCFGVADARRCWTRPKQRHQAPAPLAIPRLNLGRVAPPAEAPR